MMVAEEGYGAYFNLLHTTFLLLLQTGQFKCILMLAVTDRSRRFWRAGLDPGTAFVYPTGSWFEVRVVIDVDGDVAEMYFDDTPIYSWTWSEGSTGVSNTIAALNLYPNGQDMEPDSYFVDNVSFHEYGLGLTESKQTIHKNSNPTKNKFSINVKQKFDD